MKLADMIRKKIVSEKTKYFVLVSVGFSVLYWFVESTKDVLLLENGSLFERLFYPDTYSFWIRLLGICIFLFFGIYVESINQSRKKTKKIKIDKEDVCEEQMRINRARMVFIESNRVLVKAKDEVAFIRNICNLLVQIGDYSFVWVGFIDQNGSKYIRPISKAGGEGEYLETVVFELQENNNDDNPIHKAIRTCRPCVLQRIQSISSHPLWKSEAIKKGLLSVVSFPLQYDNEVLGVLNIYSEKEYCFVEGEIELLERLADDLAYGVKAIRERESYRELKEDKESIEEQLFSIQKSEMVGGLVSGIAHDFNNLVTAILVFTDMALEQMNKTDPIYQDLIDIQVAGKKAAELIKQLFIFSCKQTQKLTVINMNETVSNLIKMLQTLIGEDIKISSQFASDLWRINAYQGRIEQVIVNLVINARDAMPNGGELIIKTENIDIHKTLPEATPKSRPGKYVRITISDTGTGMDKNTIKQIFNPFFSTKKAGKGTGLGLSMVHRIIKQHHGWIQVQSEVNCGSTFQIYLPALLKKLEDEIERPLWFGHRNLCGDGEKVLLIEDEKKLRNFIANCLKQGGYVVHSASDAEEAIDIFQRENEDFQIIICDVVLPGKNGVELINELLLRKPDLRVLLNSGYADCISRWPDIKLKQFCYLEKPYDSNELLQVVKGVSNSMPV